MGPGGDTTEGTSGCTASLDFPLFLYLTHSLGLSLNVSPSWKLQTGQGLIHLSSPIPSHPHP